jgi:hypothetical protein
VYLIAQDVLNLAVRRNPVLTAIGDFVLFSNTNSCIAYEFLVVVVVIVLLLVFWVIMIDVFYPFNRYVWLTMCQVVTPSVPWH